MIRGGIAARFLPQKTPSTYQALIYIFFILQNFIYETTITSFLQPSLLTIVLEIWHYILVLFVVYETITVTTTDTRDPLLQVGQSEDEYDPNDLIYCVMCNAIVLKTSYHCWRCNQCSHNLDHHCKYLNCCIAQANYFPFLRLLAVFIFYSTDFILLVYFQTYKDTWIWIILALSALELLLSFALFTFHIFLAWCYHGNTLTFYNKKSRNRPNPIELREQTDIFT